MTSWNLALSCSMPGHSLEEYQMLIMFMLETAFRARNSKDDPERPASFPITIQEKTWESCVERPAFPSNHCTSTQDSYPDQDRGVILASSSSLCSAAELGHSLGVREVLDVRHLSSVVWQAGGAWLGVRLLFPMVHCFFWMLVG